MATYTVIGHPLNYSDLASTPGATIDTLTAALRETGIGQTVTLTLSAPDEAQADAIEVLSS